MTPIRATILLTISVIVLLGALGVTIGATSQTLNEKHTATSESLQTVTTTNKTTGTTTTTTSLIPTTTTESIQETGETGGNVMDTLFSPIIFSAVLSGAISAIGGALVLTFVQSIWTRRQMLAGLHAELAENKNRAKQEKDCILTSDDNGNNDWSGQLYVSYLDDMYTALRTTAPGIYIKITSDCQQVTHAYHEVNNWQGLYEASRAPSASIRADAETIADDLDEFSNELQTAMEELERMLQEKWY